MDRNEFQYRVLEVSICEEQENSCVDELGDEHRHHDHGGAHAYCVQADVFDHFGVQSSKNNVEYRNQNCHGGAEKLAPGNVFVVGHAEVFVLLV